MSGSSEGLRTPAPYVVALVELDEGPRLISNVTGCPPDDVRVGMPVRVRFDRVDGFVLPRFERPPSGGVADYGGREVEGENP